MPAPRYIPTGTRFARLVVIRQAEGRYRENKQRAYVFKCDCGNVKTICQGDVTSGNTKSCGCLDREKKIARNFKHGFCTRAKEHPLHRRWISMFNRCRNPEYSDYRLYGGRGIKLCERWENFATFLADMGECPPGLSIDRIDNNGNYEPGNCRWVTQKIQNENQRTNRILEIDGIKACLSAHAERLGIKAGTVRDRLATGWPPELALKAPKGSFLKRLLAT